MLCLMSYQIQWGRLIEEDQDFLKSLGIETGPSFVRFTRDLTWDEITLVFGRLDGLRRRTPDAEGDHVNFALGDCLNEIKRLFGRERAELFMQEYPRLSNFRDHVLTMAGATLIYLQTVENMIKLCCASLGIKLTLADFLSDDPDRRRVTLGQMKHALLKSGAFSFSGDFEAELGRFVHDRNEFVHYLWVEDSGENPVTGLPSEDDLARIEDRIQSLLAQAHRMERIFKGMWGAIGAGKARQESDASSLTPWLKYIKEFESVLDEQK
jgi:hypothetical protein